VCDHITGQLFGKLYSVKIVKELYISIFCQQAIRLTMLCLVVVIVNDVMVPPLCGTLY